LENNLIHIMWPAKIKHINYYINNNQEAQLLLINWAMLAQLSQSYSMTVHL